MAIYTTYDQVGQAEDVSDIISNISPTKTPFQTLIGSDKCSARMFEWQEDALDAVADNAKVEGFEASDVVLTATTMRSNYTQILSDTIKIAATSDAVKTYGRKRETAYQLSKKGAELKRDLEHTLVGLDQAAAVGDAASVPRRMASAYPQIDASVTDDNAAVPRALDEATLLAVNQLLYNEGAEASIFMIKPADALIVADFAKAAGRERDFGGDKKVVNVVDLYVSPFGEQRVVLNRFIKATEALLIDPDMWQLVTLRPWKREVLAKTGDSVKHMLVGEFSLKHNNFKGTGRITDLN
jgi:hypothetical protein